MPYRFFLGGRDLEMTAIRDLVSATLGAEAVVDKGLGWGAAASSYGEETAAAAASGVTPVLVELAIDTAPPLGTHTIDHHGPAAGRDAPTSLEQVFALLGLPPEQWTRRLALIAANDRGHVREMRRLGATPAEIAEIRRADRAVQGIGADDEQAGEQALQAREALLDGALTLIRLPHVRTAVVTDRLALEWTDDAVHDLLVLSPDEVNFFGHGAVVAALDRAFPGGWSGGALPDAGFWGRGRPLPDENALIDAIRDAASWSTADSRG